MVYQGKPSAGCANCRKRKIKVCRDQSLTVARRWPAWYIPERPLGWIRLRYISCVAWIIDLSLYSVTNALQLVVNVSTPSEHVPVTLRGSTLSYAIRPSLSAGKRNVRSCPMVNLPRSIPQPETGDHQEMTFRGHRKRVFQLRPSIPRVAP